MENQPKPLKTYKNQNGTMKNQSRTIKPNTECRGLLWVVEVVTGDSQKEVMIFRDTHTNIHFIIIYVSSLSSSSGFTLNYMFDVYCVMRGANDWERIMNAWRERDLW